MLIYVNIWHLQAGFIYFYLLYFISFFDQPISYTELFRTFDKSTSQNTNIYMQTKTEFHFSVLPGKLIEKFFFFFKEPRAARPWLLFLLKSNPSHPQSKGWNFFRSHSVDYTEGHWIQGSTSKDWLENSLLLCWKMEHWLSIQRKPAISRAKRHFFTIETSQNHFPCQCFLRVDLS